MLIGTTHAGTPTIADQILRAQASGVKIQKVMPLHKLLGTNYRLDVGK